MASFGPYTRHWQFNYDRIGTPYNGYVQFHTVQRDSVVLIEYRGIGSYYQQNNGWFFLRVNINSGNNPVLARAQNATSNETAGAHTSHATFVPAGQNLAYSGSLAHVTVHLFEME